MKNQLCTRCFQVYYSIDYLSMIIASQNSRITCAKKHAACSHSPSFHFLRQYFQAVVASPVAAVGLVRGAQQPVAKNAQDSGGVAACCISHFSRFGLASWKSFLFTKKWAIATHQALAARCNRFYMGGSWFQPVRGRSLGGNELGGPMVRWLDRSSGYPEELSCMLE